MLLFSLFFTPGYNFKQEFLTDTGDYYKASLERLDFAQSEVARQTINTWVEEQTNQKIKDIIRSGMINTLTVMVLVNAIYFKGIMLTVSCTLIESEFFIKA